MFVNHYPKVCPARLKGFPGMASVARTHFGPIMESNQLSEISFYLASPWIFAKDMVNLIWSEAQEKEQAGGTAAAEAFLLSILKLAVSRL